jgi:hypothetical protein
MATYTKINGKAYSHSSIEVQLNGKSYPFVKEVSYSDDLEPGEVRGTSAQLLSRTRGEYKAEASITLYKGAAQELLDDLGDGFMEKEFDMVVTRKEDDMSTIIDTVVKCRIKKHESGSSTGSDPNEVKFDLHPMYILWNGYSPIAGLIKG